MTFILGSLSSFSGNRLCTFSSSGHWQKALNPADGSVTRMHYARSISQPSYARLILQCSYCVGLGSDKGKMRLHIEVDPGDDEGLTALRRAVTICLPTASETRGMEDIIKFFLWQISC